MLTKTWMAKKEQAEDLRDWYHVDADGQIVGRLATALATVLMGKHKANYTPHVDSGGTVIVTNVERIAFSGKDMVHPNVPYYSTKMAKRLTIATVAIPAGDEFARLSMFLKQLLNEFCEKPFAACFLKTNWLVSH